MTSHESGRHSTGQKCHATWHGYAMTCSPLSQPLLVPASSLPVPRLAGHPTTRSQCPTSFPRSQSHFLMVFASPCCLPHDPATLQLQVLLPVSSPLVWSQFLVGRCSRRTLILVPRDRDALQRKSTWACPVWASTDFFNSTELLLSLYHAQ